FQALATKAKREQAQGPFRREIARLARSLTDDEAEGGIEASPEDGIEVGVTALIGAVAGMPVYRTYVAPAEGLVADADRRAIDEAGMPTAVAQRLTLERPAPAEFVTRFQQTTPPVVAKGVEDTAFYRYNRLVSLNEVGAEPDLLGPAVEDFHRHNALAAARWPNRMITLATHDTKRAPDVRARLNVLSELPSPWHGAVTRWSAHNDRYRRGRFPDRNAEYLLYQTLLGAWPIGPERTWGYMQKAIKEAKVHTSWTDPVAEYDQAVQGFVTDILADERFVADLTAFMAEQGIVEAGRTNALAQTALLLTAPGSPDLYQGTELWDHSLVDPDNRRPVDYGRRRALLAKLRQAGPAEALAHHDDGGSKLWLIQRLLAHRRRCRDLYGPDSGYQPLTAQGTKASHLVAFARGGGLAVVIPRLVAGLHGWDDTSVNLPLGRWVDIATGAAFAGGAVPVADLLAQFPVAVLEDQGR
ncbi:MAG: hypothetical protein M3N98_08730, partial [Actinomycetota bacterium]|nr:hypothetical protein [Actinomycetota bacterium]